jgi:hypothetical protein
VASSLILISILYLCGLVVVMVGNVQRGADPKAPAKVSLQFIAAMLSAVALIGLMFSFSAVLWGEVPQEQAYSDSIAWRRWLVVGGIVVGILFTSGRAVGCALLGGIIWAGVGVYSGLGQESRVAAIDEMVIAAFVGTIVGAVGGTLLNLFRPRRK